MGLNIQTIPRGDKVVKAAFLPKLDGIAAWDYPNIELKLLAFYLESLGWPSMAEVFRAGADLHLETAAGILGKATTTITDAERQIGKVLNFSIVYGGGPNTVHEQLGISFPEALNVVAAYHRAWPGIGWDRKKQPAYDGTLIATIKEQVANRGYIKTLYGRHLRPKAMHAALNNLCQGCAADLMKWAMVRVDDGLREGGFRSHVINMVHDELMFDIARDELPALLELVPEWMTDPRIEAVVPIKPTAEVSWTSWADKATYPPEA